MKQYYIIEIKVIRPYRNEPTIIQGYACEKHLAKAIVYLTEDVNIDYPNAKKQIEVFEIKAGNYCNLCK